jgi:hypothetical protein
MSEKIIIQHLMSGINPDFRKELSRRESSITTLNEFLQYAKIEQDLHDTFRDLSVDTQQPYSNYNQSSIPSLTATVNQSKQHYRKTKHNNSNSYPTLTQSSVTQGNSIPQFEHRTRTLPPKQVPNNPQQFNYMRRQNNQQSTSQNKFLNCKICNRTNHRTIDCFHKCTTGCFKCGQPNHNVRDCPTTQNFQ